MPVRRMVTFKPIRVPLARTVNDKDLYDAMVDEIKSFATDLKGDFEATTDKWKKKPKFEVKSTLTGNKVEFKVYTSSLIYYMLSKGIKRHHIYPKKKVLKLKGVTRTGTFTLVSWKTVGLIKVPVTTSHTFTTQAFASGKGVKHPGVKKRDYPAKILRLRKPTFSPRMHAAIDRALKRIAAR